MAEQNKAALHKLFGRLKTFKVLKWSSSSSDKDTDRVSVALEDADVVASLRNDGSMRHDLLLDIDHPCWLVKSSTPGHFHLYVDMGESGIPPAVYYDLLAQLGGAGVIETGYANASISRGHSDLRLPWIKKEKT